MASARWAAPQPGTALDSFPLRHLANLFRDDQLQSINITEKPGLVALVEISESEGTE